MFRQNFYVVSAFVAVGDKKEFENEQNLPKYFSLARIRPIWLANFTL